MGARRSAEIRELLSEGRSTDEIVDLLGVSPGSVAAVRANITRGTYSSAQRRGGGVIYLQRDGELVEMAEQAYDSEDALQALLASHPGLLAGDEVGDEPRRWVLLSREVGVADSADRGGRWSLDHLFVDQDAIPTLVEVKRSSDTRIRREVVGQLLEYAANGSHYWPVEQLRALFEATCRQRDRDPVAVLRESFGEGLDVTSWWEETADNLVRGRLRLVFVADVMPRELRQIIEFLNDQMTETEVLGVEIRRYVAERGEPHALVPRLIGQTERARATKSPSHRPIRDWDRETMLAGIEKHRGREAARVAENLFGWADANPAIIFDFGKGGTTGTATFRAAGDVALTALRLFSDGGVQIPFSFMSDQAPFGDSPRARDELRRRISAALPGEDLAAEEDKTNPGFKVDLLAAPAAFEGFVAALSWAIAQADEAQHGEPG